LAGRLFEGFIQEEIKSMLGKNIYHKFVTLTTLAAVWCVYSMVAFAMPVDQAAEITVTGQVTVNGQPAVSNSTIMSGAVIAAGAGSNAVVSLGKLGRVEVLSDSNATLVFSSGSIVVTLSAGQTRVSSASGVAATVTTKDATVIADSSQADNFLVQVECSHTTSTPRQAWLTCEPDRTISRSLRVQRQLPATLIKKAAHLACVRIQFRARPLPDCPGCCFWLLPEQVSRSFLQHRATTIRHLAVQFL